MGCKCKKKKECPAGVPEWVVTYGDMMSLLLCFFILLAAFSELKKEHEYQRVITAVKEAFGYSGGVGVMPTDDPPLRSMIELLENISQRQMKESRVAQSPEQGIKGRKTRVKRVHDGLMFTMGGHVTFEAGSAELLDSAREALVPVADLLRGRNNKIAVRGHASRGELEGGSEFADLRDLSYYRAKAVADHLITELRIPQHRLVVDARGDTEPIALRKFSDQEQTDNRRVEVIMLEVMVEELHPDADYTSEDAARG